MSLTLIPRTGNIPEKPESWKMLKLALEHASCALCWWLTGLRGVSLCALAWALEWRLWVAFWDAVLWPHEKAHCRASYERCFDE